MNFSNKDIVSKFCIGNSALCRSEVELRSYANKTEKLYLIDEHFEMYRSFDYQSQFSITSTI